MSKPFVHRDKYHTFPEEVSYIAEHSHNSIILAGPSGSGKGLIIDFLQSHYGFVTLPFVTTRALRAGEEESGSEHMSHYDFLALEYQKKLFLSVTNYGNLYGYRLSTVIDHLSSNKIIIFEAPASRITTVVEVLLPKALKLGIIPPDGFCEVTLPNRNTESVSNQKLRQMRSLIELEELRFAYAHANRMYPILPTLGEPEWTIKQIRRVIEKEMPNILRETEKQTSQEELQSI